MYTKISPVPSSSKKIERLEKSIGLKIEENNVLNIKKTESPHFRLQALHSSEKHAKILVSRKRLDFFN